MRNVPRLLELADFIEGLSFDAASNGAGLVANTHGFDMSRWHTSNDCGTTCCIGGWAIEKFGDPKMVAQLRDADSDVIADARALLGLEYDEAEDLFLGRFSDSDMEDITPQEAAAELRRIASNG